MRALANQKTHDLLAYLEARTLPGLYREKLVRHWRERPLELPTRDLATLRARLLKLNDLLIDLSNEDAPLYAEGDPTRFDWLFILRSAKSFRFTTMQLH